MPSRVVHIASHRPFPDVAPTVLLIDDDQMVLGALEIVLQEAGFRVLTARNGLEGINVFRRQNPKLVVTDIMMPEQDGLGVIMQMRRERADVSIIAMSGGGYIDTCDYLPIARRLGADATFHKAEDVEALIERLRGLIQLSYRAAS
jgi:DNA-binding response OmpR family regulator